MLIIMDKSHPCPGRKSTPKQATSRVGIRIKIRKLKHVLLTFRGVGRRSLWDAAQVEF